MPLQKLPIYARILIAASAIAPSAAGEEPPVSGGSPSPPAPTSSEALNAPPPPPAPTFSQALNAPPPPPPVLAPVFKNVTEDKPAEDKSAGPGEYKLGPANFRIGFGMQVGLRLQSSRIFSTSTLIFWANFA